MPSQPQPLFRHRQAVRALITLIMMQLAAISAAGQSLFRYAGSSPRVLGLAGPHLLAPADPLAASWSPALLGALREGQFAVSPADAFRISSLGLAAFWPQSGGIGASLHDLSELGNSLKRLDLGWGRALGPYFSAGIAVHGNRSDDKNFGTATVGVLLHPFADSPPMNYGAPNADVYSPPFSPYRFAVGVQANDIALGERRLTEYYQASAAMRFTASGASLFATVKWQAGEAVPAVGLAVPIVPRVALYSGITDFTAEQTAFGATYLASSFNIDLAYTVSDKALIGGLSLRLGPSHRDRARHHLEAGKHLAKSKEYRAALHELQAYRVYDSNDAFANRLSQALDARVHAVDRQIEQLLWQADSLEDAGANMMAAWSYLRVLNIQRENRRARSHLEALQPSIDVYTNQLFGQGVQALESGDPVAAKRAFKTIRLLRPDHEKAAQYLAEIDSLEIREADQLFWRGLGYFSQRNFKNAATAFAEVLALNPNHPEAAAYLTKSQKELERQNEQIHKMLAEVARLTRNEQYVRAHEICRQISRLDPDNEAARTRMSELQPKIDGFVADNLSAGKLAFQRGDFERADRHFAAVLSMSPGSKEAKQYRDRIAEGIRQQVQFHLRNGMDYFSAGEWLKAAAAFERVLELDPSQKLAQSKRNQALSHSSTDDLLANGEAYLRAGEYYKAMDTFNRVLAKEPLNQTAIARLDYANRQLNLLVDRRFNRALNFYANEEYDKTLQELDAVLKLNPSHAQALDYRERVQLKISELNKITQ